MIQLNIKEQELKAYGETVSDRLKFYNNWEFKGPTFNINDTDVVEGVDYHMLSYENRSINLDTILVPNGYIVTGLRFSLANGHITINVRGTEFDYTSGQLIKDRSEWFSNLSSSLDELILGDVAPPFEKGITPVVNRTPNLFVKFGPTDYWSDIGQTTVPLISKEKVIINEGVPLAGVGLYHKSAMGFGGFIALKIIELDIGYYIPDN